MPTASADSHVDREKRAVMGSPVIVEAVRTPIGKVRTPIGKRGGWLADVHPTGLLGNRRAAGDIPTTPSAPGVPIRRSCRSWSKRSGTRP